jgi:hypothetical protein
MHLDLVTAADFQPHAGSSFVVKLPGGSFPVELVEVTEQPQHARGGRTPFSLVFRGPAQPIISQGTYLFSHDVLGEASIFIVPIQPDSLGSRYEAVFN